MKTILRAISEVGNILLFGQDKYHYLQEVVRVLGQGVGVDRCYIFGNHQLPDGRLGCSQLVEWAADSISIQINNPVLQNIVYESFPGLLDYLSINEPYYGLVSQMDNPAFKEAMAAQEILTFLFAPIYSDGEYWGFIGFDDCQNERHWEKDEVDALFTVASNIGMKISMDKIQKEKDDYIRRYQLASEGSGIGIWEYNVRSGELYLSDIARKHLGLESSKITGKEEILERIHPDDRVTIKSRFQQYLEGVLPAFTAEFRIVVNKGAEKWMRGSGYFQKQSESPHLATGTIMSIHDLKLKEETIQAQKVFFEEVLNSADVNLIITGLNDEIKYYNRNSLNSLGSRFKQFGGPDWDKVIYEEDTEKLWKFYQDAFTSTGVSQSAIVRFVAESSEQPIRYYKIWANNQLHNPLFNGVLFFGNDITQVYQAEIQLAEARRQLQVVLANLKDIVYVINAVNNGLTYISSADEIMALTGYQVHDFQGDIRLWDRLVMPGHRAEYSRTMDFLLKKATIGTIIHMQYPIKHRNGDIKWINDRMRKSERDGLQFVDGILSDITEATLEKQAYEKAIYESREMYRHIAENIQDLVCLHHPDGRYQYVSPVSESLLGYKPEELIGLDPYQFFHPDDIPLLRSQHQELLQKKGGEILTYRYKTKSGQYIWLETLTTHLYDNRKKITGLQTASRDITVRRRAEEELANSLQKEKDLNELKSQFISLASHQFRTPLAVIFSNAELLELIAANNRFDKNKSNKITQAIKNETQRMTELMENMLILGRYDSGFTNLNLLKINIVKLITDLNQNYFQQEPDNRKLKIHKPKNIKNWEIVADEMLLLHTFTNLINNAFKYSKGQPAPELYFQQNNHQIEVKIIDYGIGIPQNEIPFLFNSFYRAANTSTIQGSGLGLVLCKKFIDMLGGKIHIISELGQGTTVSVFLNITMNRELEID